MKCYKCEHEIDVNEDFLEFKGEASVYGVTTLSGFHNDGVVWDRVGDSMSEEIKCPNCAEWITPDMVEVRRESSEL